MSPPRSGMLPEFDTLMMIAARLETACEADARLREVDPGDLIRHVPGKRAIFHCVFEGQAAVVRMNLTGNGDSVRAEWDEMLRLWPYMSEGPYRIAEPLHASPGQGIIVIGAAPGTPMLQLIWGMQREDRGPLLTSAARWLRQCTAMSEGWRVAAPGGWVKRARAACENQAFDSLAAYEGDILAELDRLGAQIDGAQWRTAISHGDYHPNNLVVSAGGRLTGIDISGSRRMPIYKDMARFLMHLGRRRVGMGGGLKLGVARPGIAAFAEAFALEPQERDLILPFFLAFEALIRVETKNLPSSRIRRAEKMYSDLLKDLRKVGT